MKKIADPKTVIGVPDSIPFGDVAALLSMSSGRVMLLHRDGRVVYCPLTPNMSSQCRAMLQVDGGVLHTPRAEEDKALQDALAGLTAAAPTAIVCLRNREGVAVAVLDMQLLDGSGLVALRFTRFAPQPGAEAERLGRIFGLTRAETRVAAALMAGMSQQGIAALHMTASETIRSQVKRVRAKTGAVSQAQLVGILVRAAADLGRSNSAVPLSGQSP